MADRAPTEESLEATRNLDELPVEDILGLIYREDRRAVEAVAEALPAVAKAASLVERALRAGGRWFNVGAGTSGRMAASDAAELQPTFGCSPEWVQAVIAGGERALSHPVEGAEDDVAAAREELERRELAEGDVVLAISASGRTRFSLAALELARERGVHTIALTCDPDSPLAGLAEVVIAPRVGAEVIAGSTRMKGGLVQKMILHSLSTAVMVRLGRVEGNRMTHLQPVSEKLRQRAREILMELTSVDEATARELLDSCDGRLKDALRKARSSQ